jgi:IclR family transcriptional regulator, acetate operon repressor
MAHIPAERCLGIIELLAREARTLPLRDIADALDLPKSGAHRLLATLVELGWASQDADSGHYRLTMRLAILGQQLFTATGIPDVCQPLLNRLANLSRDFVRLAVVDGRTLVWVADAQGATRGLLYYPALTTNTVPLYATASGKAWLATLSSEEATDNVMANGGFDHADRYGPNALRSMKALQRELKATARRGYGLAFNEAESGITAVAAAIRPSRQAPAVGTVSVAGPSVRMTPKRVHELAPLVLQTAADLSNVWPLRLRGGERAPRSDVAEAA